MLTKELYGLQVSKDLETEADLILSRSDSPLVKEDMAYVEKKMLETYDIPGLLPIEFEEKDRYIRLRYRLPPGQTLEQALSGKMLTNQELYQLLHALVQRLEDCRIYMLNEHRFVLQASYLFIGQSFDDLSRLKLVYIPMNELPGKGTVQQDLINLVDGLVKNSSIQPDEQWKAVKALLMNEMSFSLRELKRQLEDSLHLHKPAQHIEETKTASPIEGTLGSIDAASVNQPLSQQESPFVSNHSTESVVTPDGEPQWKKIRTILLAAAGIMLISWSYYLSDPQDALMYICLGVTLLGLDLVYVLHVKGLLKRELFQTAAAVYAPHGSSRPAADEQVRNDVPRDDTGGKGGLSAQAPSASTPSSERAISVEEWAASRVAMLQAEDQQRHTEEAESTPTAAEQKNNEVLHKNAGRASFQKSNSSQDYYASLTQQTTLLVPQDATIKLADPFSKQEEPLEPVLEIERAEGTEKLTLSGKSFRIGRNQEGVHYTDLTVGVSRIHLEFTHKDSEAVYFVKDLGSKNGSFLNGERMIPYQEYELKDEDEIRYAEVKAKFKMKLAVV